MEARTDGAGKGPSRNRSRGDPDQGMTHHADLVQFGIDYRGADVTVSRVRITCTGEWHWAAEVRASTKRDDFDCAACRRLLIAWELGGGRRRAR